MAFLSRTLDADAGAPIPCLWYCMRVGEQDFEVGGVKLDCSKIGFDEVAAAAASNGIDSVLAYLGESPAALSRCAISPCAVSMPGCPIRSNTSATGTRPWRCSARSRDAGSRPTASTTLTYRASLGNAAAAKLAAGALAMRDSLSGRGDAVEAGRRL